VASKVDADGTALAVKTAALADDMRRLEHEAAMLDAARHPSVVALRRFEKSDGGAELVTTHAGTHTLASIGRLRVDHVAGLVAGVASALADLHSVGVVHGRIDASHVVVGAGGRPMLCGFSGAAPVGASPPPAPPTTPWDAPRPDPAPLQPEDDVRDLGLLLRALLDAEPDHGEPIPERRGLPWRRSWAGYHPRSLLTLADQASADDPTRRPTAAAFAAAILEAVPDASLPAPADPAGVPLLGTAGLAASARPRIFAPTADTPVDTLDARAGRGVSDTPPAPSIRRPAAHAAPRARTLRPLGIAAAALVLVVGGIQLARQGRAPDVAVAPPTDATATPASAPAPSALAVPEATACPMLSDPTAVAADVDGDGCPDAVHVSDGVVEVAGARWAVGQAGDEMLVGDWNCDGVATVAVVRPATGEVFVFNGWADTGADLVATAVPSVSDARSASARDEDGDGCPRLVVTGAAGERTEVTL
jgi:hypothetical protein